MNSFSIQGQPSQQQTGGSAEVATLTTTVTVSAEATMGGVGPTSTTDDKPDGKNVPVAEGVVLL